MKCKSCGNRTRFTMLKEIGSWNVKEKKFDLIEDSDEYYVCDACLNESEVGGHIDTEGEY